MEKPLKNKKVIEIKNPTQEYWNDINAKYVVQAKMWRNIAIIVSLALIIAIIGIIHIASQTKIVPYLFKEDATGGITPLGIPSERFIGLTANQIAAQLADYIVDLREVPLDKGIASQFLNKVYAMSSTQLFMSKIKVPTALRYKNNSGSSITVVINNVIPVDSQQNIWEIDWTEYKDSVYLAKYKGTIKYSLSGITNPAQIMTNPLGFTIIDCTINEDMS